MFRGQWAPGFEVRHSLQLPAAAPAWQPPAAHGYKSPLPSLFSLSSFITLFYTSSLHISPHSILHTTFPTDGQPKVSPSSSCVSRTFINTLITREEALSFTCCFPIFNSQRDTDKGVSVLCFLSSNRLMPLATGASEVVARPVPTFVCVRLWSLHSLPSFNPLRPRLCISTSSACTHTAADFVSGSSCSSSSTPQFPAVCTHRNSATTTTQQALNTTYPGLPAQVS